jgi:hypothetical protein
MIAGDPGGVLTPGVNSVVTLPAANTPAAGRYNQAVLRVTLGPDQPVVYLGYRINRQDSLYDTTFDIYQNMWSSSMSTSSGDSVGGFTATPLTSSVLSTSSGAKSGASSQPKMATYGLGIHSWVSGDITTAARDGENPVLRALLQVSESE